ncbi:hypothetical protein L9F63_009672, partial [Diploptera punctata]
EDARISNWSSRFADRAQGTTGMSDLTIYNFDENPCPKTCFLYYNLPVVTRE